MGCDIHFYVEKKIDGKWLTADRWSKDEYEEGQFTVDYKDQFYNGRSYCLFSILADVRNGSGFAGVKTGEGFIPMSAPRGVPDDSCPEYRKLQEDYGCDGHSHSYFTLSEILAYDWTQKTKQQGWVTPSEWAQWRDFGKPKNWSGGVMGGSVKHLTNEDFEAAWQVLRAERDYPESRYASAHLNSYKGDEEDVSRMYELLGGSPHTLVEWTVPYYEAINTSFFSATIPRLLRIAAGHGGTDNVRIVFFFDN